MVSKLDLFLNGNYDDEPKKERIEKKAMKEDGELCPMLDHQSEKMSREIARLEKAGEANSPRYRKLKRRIRNMKIGNVVGSGTKNFTYDEFSKAMMDGDENTYGLDKKAEDDNVEEEGN